jgi:uncharacterized repeat protein (TIGR03803 family)
VFSVNTDGSGFATLYNFGNSNDGAAPQGNLVLAGKTLYGTGTSGGSSGNGTVFKISTGGTGFTTLYSFTATSYSSPPFVSPLTNTDGAFPVAGLVLLSNTLYGTTMEGGASGNGTVFKVNTDGTSFAPLYSFAGPSDGAAPTAGLVRSGNTLYGTASAGGTGGNGAIFAVRTDGTGFTNLYSFTPFDPTTLTNSDGANPPSTLVLSGTILYGTTAGGGASGNGTVFKIMTDGTGFVTLYNFTGPLHTNDYPYQLLTNVDGAVPKAGLVLVGDLLYGTTSQGGAGASGTVWALNSDGAGFRVVYAFTPSGSDGASPRASLLLSGNTFYGTTIYGGAGFGNLFSISLAPQLSITRFGPDVILSWPTSYLGFDYSGYTLQSATNLVSPVWTTNLPAPVVINGQYTVTNPISGTQQFFRLSQ